MERTIPERARIVACFCFRKEKLENAEENVPFRVVVEGWRQSEVHGNVMAYRALLMLRNADEKSKWVQLYGRLSSLL